MKKLLHNKVLILLFVLLIVFVVLFVISLINRSQPEDEQQQQIIQSPGSSSRQLIPEEGRPFEVLSEPPTQELRINEPVTFAFSLPVQLEDIVISVEPATVIRMELDSSGTVLSVLPENFWQPDTEYSIKILTKTVSVNEKNLTHEQEIRFRTQKLGGM